MTTGKGPYSRVYHSIVDDPEFEAVYDNDAALATWLRMLIVADAMHPASAPLPRRNSAVRSLLDSGLVIEKPGNRYTIRGLSAERERRSAPARKAAAVRWQSDGNADAMPRRDETSKDKTSNGAGAFLRSAPGKPGLHDGHHGRSCGVCFPPEPPKEATA